MLKALWKKMFGSKKIVSPTAEVVVRVDGENKTTKEDKMKFDHPDCDRCDGTGHIPKFSHIRNGRCYECNGTGVDKWTFENETVAVWKARGDWFIQSKKSNHWVKLDPDNKISWSEGFPEDKKTAGAEWAKAVLAKI